MAPWLGGLLGCGRGQNPSSGLPCGPVFGGVEWWAVGGRGVARTRLRGPCRVVNSGQAGAAGFRGSILTRGAQSRRPHHGLINHHIRHAGLRRKAPLVRAET